MSLEEARQRIDTAVTEGSARLSLSGLGLTAVPESLAELSNLTMLDLASNQLTAVPESIGQLTNLTQLWLDNNQLTAVPESIGQLTNLATLWLFDNQLTAVPESIAQLTNLIVLHLASNQLTAVPESIAQLTNLSTLYLDRNQLTALPESLGRLTNLTTLTLHRNPLPKSLLDAVAVDGVAGLRDWFDNPPRDEPSLDEIGVEPGDDLAVGGYADGLVPTLTEQLSEDDSLALWRELEAFRTELQQIFDDKVLPDADDYRARGQLDALKEELHRVGGALGGATRSYILALTATVSKARNLPDASAHLVQQSPDAQPFSDLISGAAALARDPLEAALLSPTLDSVAELAWLATSASANAPSRSAVYTEIDRRIGVGQRVSDSIEFLSAGLKDQKSLIASGTVAATATTAALRLETLTAAQAATATAFGAVISSMLAMAHFTYRVDRRLKPHPTRSAPGPSPDARQ